MTSTASRAPLLIPKALVAQLLRLYDYPHPTIPRRIIRGCDRPHAVRTARMCAAVAATLGHDPARVRQYQIACLLHDLGRGEGQHRREPASSHQIRCAQHPQTLLIMKNGEVAAIKVGTLPQAELQRWIESNL